MNRREALATTGTVLVGGYAGCSTPFRTTISKVSVGVRIPKEDFSAYDFAIDESATLDYTIEVNSGPAIDVLVMDRSNFGAYRDENYGSVTFLSDFSHTDTMFANTSGEVGAGRYNLVVDNTGNVGTNPPPDSKTAVVSVDYLLYR